MRIIQDVTRFTAPFQTQFPVTSTTTRLALSLSWPPGRENILRATLMPPGGGSPIDIVPAPGAATFLSNSFRLPLPSGVNAWACGPFKFSEPQRQRRRRSLQPRYGDDDDQLLARHRRADYAVGGKVKLTAQINDSPRPSRSQHPAGAS
jgi:hypothetical protein